MSDVKPDPQWIPGAYDGTTMREVLEWASENVWSLNSLQFSKDPARKWLVSMPPDDPVGFYAHTLYDAIYSSWKERGEKS